MTLLTVPEPKVEPLKRRPLSLRDAIAVIGANLPFLWLLGGLGVFLAGAVIGASLHLIVIERVFHARPLFPIILAGENVAGLVSLPFWMGLARRLGKHRATAIAAGMMGLLSAPIPLIPHGRADLLALCIIVRGLAGTAPTILIASMIADVVDIDTLKTGRSRNGIYFAITGALSNLGIALGALLGGVLPTAFGFATAGPANSPQAVFGLMVTYAWIPTLIMAGAAPFFWAYPLTEAVQKGLRAQIDAARPPIEERSRDDR
jgi:Na+/melibiose symporter-like transporter